MNKSQKKPETKDKEREKEEEGNKQ